MIAELLNEPELEFGGGFRHVDIRFGIMSYGPFDVTSELAPKRIRIGIVGTEKSVERFLCWLEQCKSGLQAKAGNKPNLFPRFPGLGEDVGLRATVVTGKELIRTIQHKSILEVLKIKDHNDAVTQAVELFLRELDYVSKSKNVTPNVLVCAPPLELFQYFEKSEDDDEDAESEEDTANTEHLDFHDLLKAKSLSLLMPIQFVRPSTYDQAREKSERRRRCGNFKIPRPALGTSIRRSTTRRVEHPGDCYGTRATTHLALLASVSTALLTNHQFPRASHKCLMNEAKA
jgi:hypothetical protein